MHDIFIKNFFYRPSEMHKPVRFFFIKVVLLLTFQACLTIFYSYYFAEQIAMLKDPIKRESFTRHRAKHDFRWDMFVDSGWVLIFGYALVQHQYFYLMNYMYKEAWIWFLAFPISTCASSVILFVDELIIETLLLNAVICSPFVLLFYMAKEKIENPTPSTTH